MLLGHAIFDVRRRRPLIVVGSGGGRRLLWPAKAALDAVEHIADVAYIDHAAAPAAEAVLPTWWQLPSMGARVFLPGADPGDPETRHPVVAVHSRHSAPAALPAIGKVIERWALNPGSGDLGLRLAEAESTIATLKGRLAETDTALRAARADRDSARTELEQAQAPVFADTNAQFEHELWRTWLQQVAEGERNTWPLREWELGPEFLDSVESLQSVSRARIIQTCVDAVTRRYVELPGRAAHQIAVSGRSHSSSGYIARESDGATAWRIAVATVGPSAPRLMFWETPDDIVELSLVAVHDDVRIV